MDYTPQSLESKWQQYWKDNETYKVSLDNDKPKYYVLDMFPYPSGAGLHVGHPLGYIASDIFSRYKRLNGFNVLHPMGYDAFGLPAEQYAIQTGVHPADSTATNIARYRQQLDNIGFSFDWSREVQTCDDQYYKWTQWIFTQLYAHYYDTKADKAVAIDALVKVFEAEGNATVEASTSIEETFTAEQWKGYTKLEQQDILMNYRLAYRKVGFVNWCEELGTVLANDEVKDGVSERGGFPVIQKPMLQWSLRTTAYAERLLNGLDDVEWSDALKTQQRNWIGRSEGAQVFFDIVGSDEQLEVYTTRPDTIFGVTYMVIAPEHDLVAKITTPEQQADIDAYLEYVNSRSERERMAEVKVVTGAFTGAYVEHPFTKEPIPVWIGEYVLKDYGTGAIMAVPADDDRDGAFAEKFGLPSVAVVDKSKYPNATLADKVGVMINSDFVTGMEVPDAIKAVNVKLEELGIGKKKINYRLRDANYSRQRYWGEPFPVSYDAEGLVHVAGVDELPVSLPPLGNFLPTAEGKSPLARLDNWLETKEGYTRETDTMPGFAGSSWYFLRYMDPNNPDSFASKEAVDYWKDVDLYVGGAEHAVGHLLYSRTWHKFLYDLGVVPTQEPFKKLVNQGMIQGRSSFVYRANERFAELFFLEKMNIAEFELEKSALVGSHQYDYKVKGTNVLIELTSVDKLPKYEALKDEVESNGHHLVLISMDELFSHVNTFEYIIGKVKTAITDKVSVLSLKKVTEVPVFVSKDAIKDESTVTALYVDIDLVDNDTLDVAGFKNWRAEFLLNAEGEYKTGHIVEKMSKSKFNVQNPDDLVGRYGADTLRLFEMFLGPIEQSKPWDTKAIGGVNKFLFKLWSLFYSGEKSIVSTDAPTKDELKVLHTCIKKVTDDIERFSLNTCVSGFMVCVNDLKKLKCSKQAVLEELLVLVAPFAPHIAEELWSALGHTTTIFDASYPKFDASHLVEDSIEYPVSINGKKRATASFAADAAKEDIEAAALALPEVQKWTEGKTVRKVIVVPKRMVNIVVG